MFPLGYELYGFWRTSATSRVRVALNLKKITVLEHIVNLDNGENRSDAFLQINPLGAIPALIIQGQMPLTQSLAILEYLEEAHPENPLLPKDLAARARVRSIALMMAADTHPFLPVRVKKYLISNNHMDDAAFRKWQTHWFTTGLQALEQRLASESPHSNYCHGDTITMADICLASIIVVMRVFKIEVENIPLINQIMGRLDVHPAFVKAEPMKQVGAPTK